MISALRHFALLALIACGSVGLTVSAEWAGDYRRTIGFGWASKKVCGENVKVRASVVEGRPSISFRVDEGYETNFEITDIGIKIGWTESDEWMSGLVRRGNSVKERVAYNVEQRAVITVGFVPIVFWVGEKAKLSRDQNRLAIKQYSVVYGIGARTWCWYRRVR